MIAQLQTLPNPGIQTVSPISNAPPDACGSQFAVLLSVLLGLDQTQQGMAPPQDLGPPQGLDPLPTGVPEKTAPGTEMGKNAGETDFCEEPDMMKETEFALAADAEITATPDEITPAVTMISGTTEYLPVKGEPEQRQAKPSIGVSPMPGTTVPLEQAAVKP